MCPLFLRAHSFAHRLIPRLFHPPPRTQLRARAQGRSAAPGGRRDAEDYVRGHEGEQPVLGGGGSLGAPQGGLTRHGGPRLQLDALIDPSNEDDCPTDRPTDRTSDRPTSLIVRHSHTHAQHWYRDRQGTDDDERKEKLQAKRNERICDMIHTAATKPASLPTQQLFFFCVVGWLCCGFKLFCFLVKKSDERSSSERVLFPERGHDERGRVQRTKCFACISYFKF